jgi:thiamine pyrophosphokinase
METVIVFAASDQPPPEVLQELPEAELVIAADGGWHLAQTLDHPVDIVVGDLDSLDPDALPQHLIVERHPEDKDATDLELALTFAAKGNPARIVVVGGSGGRLDHELAVANLICSTRWRHVEEIDWVSGRGRAHVVRGFRRLHGDVGATFTLLAVGGTATGVRTRGLKWELDSGILEPGSTLGVSNVLIAPVVEVRVDSGTALAVFPGG